VIAVLVALAADATRAQTTYPSALDPATLIAWLSQSTDLSPDQVVGVTPSSVIAILSSSREPAGFPEVLLRAEALTPEAAGSGLLAWEMRLEVDCAGGQVRAGATTGYVSRRPDSPKMSVAPAQSNWRRPSPGTALGAAWRAVCDPQFRYPLSGSAGKIALAPPARPAHEPQARPASRPIVQAAVAAAEPATSKVPSGAPSRGGRSAVQVISSPVEADTRRSLDGLRSRLGDRFAGLEARIEPAQVRGHTVYRGVVAGFSTHAEAAAFCQTLKGKGQDCLTR
jgi:hypothetical protein